PELSAALLDGPLSSDVDPNWVDLVRRIYLDPQPGAWNPRWSYDSRARQLLLDALVQNGGRLTLHALEDLGIRYTTVRNATRQTQGTPPSALRWGWWDRISQLPAEGLERGAELLTCPHCGEWASTSLWVPEIALAPDLLDP